ncbi:MAG: PC4/YdbC family ssDNA-binding protein [Polyangiaceae bacterium]
MSDSEQVVATIDRGEHGQLRVARKSFRGSALYTDLRLYTRGPDGKLYPTQKGVTIRDGELSDVLHALERIQDKAFGATARSGCKPSPTDVEELDREGVF